jgi:hypothetical protein
MHASKIPLRKWLYGMYLVVTARKGISSYQLAKELGPCILHYKAIFVFKIVRPLQSA